MRPTCSDRSDWTCGVIRDFMVVIGPISSLFDFLTFLCCFATSGATESLFHTGWFVESLATQTLVLFVIRTMGNPLRSRPSRGLTITTLAVVAVGVVLPMTPLAQWLGFTRLPGSYFVFLIPVTLAYLGAVEIAKRRLVRRFGTAPGRRSDQLIDFVDSLLTASIFHFARAAVRSSASAKPFSEILKDVSCPPSAVALTVSVVPFRRSATVTASKFRPTRQPTGRHVRKCRAGPAAA